MDKIVEISDEFFALRDLEKGESYFATLPSSQHYWLVEYLVASALKSNELDTELVADLFARIRANNACSTTAFMTVFELVAEYFPAQAFAKMMKAATLNEAQRFRLVSYDEDLERHTFLTQEKKRDTDVISPAFELFAHDFPTRAFAEMVKAAKLKEAQRFKLGLAQPVTQKKTRDPEVVSFFLDRLVRTGMCSTVLLLVLEGNKEDIIGDIIEDLTIFAPEALTKLALMIKGEGLVA